MKIENKTPGEIFREQKQLNPNFTFHDEISRGSFWIKDGGDLVPKYLRGSEWKEALRAEGLDENYAAFNASRCQSECTDRRGKPLMDKSRALTMTHVVIPDGEWDKLDVDVYTLELRLPKEDPVKLEFRSGGSLGAPYDKRPGAIFVLLASLLEEDTSGMKASNAAREVQRALGNRDSKTFEELIKQSEDKKALIPRNIEEYEVKLAAAQIERSAAQASSSILDSDLVHKRIHVDLNYGIFRYEGNEISGTVSKIVNEGIIKHLVITTEDGRSFNVAESNVKSWKIVS
jgi:hypothetical protein